MKQKRFLILMSLAFSLIVLPCRTADFVPRQRQLCTIQEKTSLFLDGEGKNTGDAQRASPVPSPTLEMTEDETLSIYGIWYLERVVLRSKMYCDDITKNGDIVPVDVEDYLGSQLEYWPDFLRLDDKTYRNPEYRIEYFTIDHFEDGGRFRQTDDFPSVQEFIENEGIQLYNRDKYSYVGNVQLKFFDVKFPEATHIPVGTQCVMLNDNTMLVGIWGKIILANRMVEK